MAQYVHVSKNLNRRSRLSAPDMRASAVIVAIALRHVRWVVCLFLMYENSFMVKLQRNVIIAENGVSSFVGGWSRLKLIMGSGMA